MIKALCKPIPPSASWVPDMTAATPVAPDREGVSAAGLVTKAPAPMETWRSRWNNPSPVGEGVMIGVNGCLNKGVMVGCVGWQVPRTEPIGESLAKGVSRAMAPGVSDFAAATIGAASVKGFFTARAGMAFCILPKSVTPARGAASKKSADRGAGRHLTGMAMEQGPGGRAGSKRCCKVAPPLVDVLHNGDALRHDVRHFTAG